MPNGVADNPPPRTAMQIKTTKPKIKQTALIRHGGFFASAVCNNVN
jgi:hypothetical protein